jgi:hypothetical protein
MAREGGGSGGALGWTLLGFLAGVAATLAIQTLMSANTDRESRDEASVHTPIVVQSDIPRPKAVASTPHAASAAARHTPAQAQPEAEVADDAAAAGMTSRVTRDNSESSAPQTAPN